MKTIYYFFLFLFYYTTYSQTLNVHYEYKRLVSKEQLENIPEFARDEILKPKYFTLIDSNGFSIYITSKTTDTLDVVKNVIDENIEGDKKTITNTSYVINRNKNEEFYFKDFKEKIYIFKINQVNESLNGKDSFVDWNWEIDQETQTINNFICKKAISKKFGVIFTAWFTEDIPISDGPEKYCGLPGLILKVSNQYFEIFATHLSISKETTAIEKPKLKGEIYTFQDMQNYVNKNIRKSGTTTETKSDGTVITTTTSVIKN